ncbi:MAG: HAD-IA family hydrolase [Pseudomonadota bacterium]
MFPKAILIGSIGVVAETSDIQRRAYNQAFREAGLDWHWDVETYKDLLKQNGGRDRLRTLSFETNADLSEKQVLAIHARKTDIACAEIIEDGVDLRPGVVELLTMAAQEGAKLAFVTTTYRQNIDAIAQGARPKLDLNGFDAIMTTNDVEQTKPHPEIYEKALNRLSLKPGECLAIEDSETSLKAAKAAGIETIITPGQFTIGQDFSLADAVYTDISVWCEHMTQSVVAAE